MKIASCLQKWVAEKRYCLTDLSLSDVAEEFGVTSQSLSYFFATVVKERFSTFRKCLRLEEAKRIILEEPGCKLLVVAARVGIPDKCNFRKQFHEKYGLSPSEWQKQCSESDKALIGK